MSWRERMRCVAAKRSLAAVVLLAGGLAAVSGCTVEPLYSAAPASGAVTGSIGGDLSTIAIKPATNRVEQEVRNNLIFLFGGGQGEPANPRYSLDVNVSTSSEATANIQINRENEPTAAILTAYASYRLTEADGTVFSTGDRQFAASYDVPRQEFAAVRARRDAENRAARELAELVRLAVAQDLKRGPHAPPPPPDLPKAIFSSCQKGC
jgi:LPS-assembly lipoprotein